MNLHLCFARPGVGGATIFAAQARRIGMAAPGQREVDRGGGGPGRAPRDRAAGVAMEDDLRAEVDLQRTKLDLLKRAFRRHCLGTMG